MKIKIPEILDFSNYKAADCNLKTSWQISVPPEDSLAWSIVLAYLMPVVFNKNKKDFIRRISKLASSEEYYDDIKKAIMTFNPFRNRFSCFYNDNLKKLVRDLKLKMDLDNLNEDEKKLSFASDFLKCSIRVIYNHQSDRSLAFSPSFDSEVIILVSSADQFSFCLNFKRGSKMKKDALKCFLGECGIHKINADKILSNIHEKHFLVHLLENGFGDIISKLYNTPYIVSKIEEAGYQTDPKFIDKNDFSTFYHAVVKEEKTCYELYFFAANGCFQTKANYRNPNSMIVSNLEKIEDILQKDIIKSKEENISEHKKMMLYNLLTLNHFLLEINKKMVTINNSIYRKKEKKVVLAKKRVRKMISLLDTYLKHFDMYYSDKQVYEKVDLSCVKDFGIYQTYCNILDVVTSFIFYDNVYPLKLVLTEENRNKCADMESEFFVLIASIILIDGIKKFTDINFESSFLHEISSCLRKNFHKKIKCFRKILKKINTNKCTIIDAVPLDELPLLLKSYPEIKGYYQIERLEKYLNIMQNIKLSKIQNTLEFRKKYVFAIERTIQVIGECLEAQTGKNESIKFLSIYLPKNIYLLLRRLRNTSSHLKSFAFPFKFKAEEDFTFFESLAKDINAIGKYLMPFFSIQIVRKNIYNLEFLEKAAKQVNIRDEHMTFIRDTYSCKSKQYFPHIHTVFCTLIDNLNSKLALKNFDQNFTDIKDIIWSLRNLIELILKCQGNKSDSLLQILEISRTIDNIPSGESIALDFFENCKNYINEYNKIKRGLFENIELKNTHSINKFYKILSGFSPLSESDIEIIRKEIPDNLKHDVKMKEIIEKSVKDGFTLTEEELEGFKVSYLNNKSWEKVKLFYIKKNKAACEILKQQDPIKWLDEVLAKNMINESLFIQLCEKMKFSEDAKNKLLLLKENLKTTSDNRLEFLLDRIRWLRKFLIEENKNIQEMWSNVKSKKSQYYVFDKIKNHYLNNSETQAAVELLLLDCMVLFEKVPCYNLWIKPSQMYTGIRLRNVIAHGDVILEKLCDFLDPGDLPSHFLRKAIPLIKDEEIIIEILQLYECTKGNFTEFKTRISSEENNDYSVLGKKVLLNNRKKYLLLLPYTGDEQKSLIDYLKEKSPDRATIEM